MLVLAVGDAHIPSRAIDMPSKFKKLLSIPDKISHVALLGNSTQSPEFLNFLDTVSSNITIVRGEFDKPTIITNRSEANGVSDNYEETNIPLVAVIKEGEFRIGCCNGYTVVPKSDPLSLLALARQLDVDIMLWGGTHNVEAYTLEEKFFVNPGSCTGAFSSDWPIINDTISNNTFEPSNAKEVVGKEGGKSQNDDITTSDGSSKAEDTGNTVADSNVNKQDTKDTTEDEASINEEDISISEVEISGSNVPSFCLLDIQGSTCTLYIYMFIDGEVKVDKVTYKKPIDE
ncbi:similar to Saccharomyces cerevisiae YHR012W VPS29 Endosomal protein that is a subunit of the membrane-associated retromer complex essential for endosome-to-Golgi retrograde transport [Maudiozyma saulgeensis]|uniref:Vacuolar protein sorting-associated protein 29 n=1 Tax=Maudiozyma saulgeensis TaxID=1789683 RepID=A0A1X7QWP0_9SACH|nr:similar to Saccharomyces cerevisiae YHR012W VPS29 Endosomal protein that is a subunit of the membrane-associated retromer complex essential for endosome-to-Golgi retrograde transport [Kazachstania saulgeensis]